MLLTCFPKLYLKMDHTLKIAILLSFCVIALAKRNSQLIHIFNAQISVPESQQETTAIVSSGLRIFRNHPFLFAVRAERNKTLCNSTAAGAPYCPAPRLQCSVSVETNYGKRYSYRSDPATGGLLVTINVGTEVNFTTSELGGDQDVAELSLDFQYDSTLTARRDLRTRRNDSSLSFFSDFVTDHFNDGEEDEDPVSGQPALYHGRFWGMIPLVLLLAFLLH